MDHGVGAFHSFHQHCLYCANPWLIKIFLDNGLNRQLAGKRSCALIPFAIGNHKHLSPEKQRLRMLRKIITDFILILLLTYSWR